MRGTDPMRSPPEIPLCGLDPADPFRQCMVEDAFMNDATSVETMKTYQAPWGSVLIMISSLLVVLSAASLVGWPLILGRGTRSMVLLAQWTLPVIVLCCLPFMIRGYVITENAILVRRLFWTTRLDRGGLKSAEVIPEAMSKSLRTCGNGGGFSFTGWYWSKPLGFYRAFVTDLKRTVVLRFEKRTVVVSPDDPEDFVVALNPDNSNAATGDRRHF